MSYILDALRKADAQRVRDPARGIHAQAAPSTLDTGPDARRAAPWFWAAGAVLVLAAAGWFWSSGDDKRAPPVAAVAAAPMEVARPAPPAAAVLPPPPAVVVVVPEARRPAVRIADPEAPRVADRAAGQAAAANLPAPVAAAAAPDRSYSLAELPADVQQALPKVSISGGVYSENVAQRMLIVNGQVFNEGSEIAPGLVLEQVRPKVALLRFRGLRIAQPY